MLVQSLVIINGGAATAVRAYYGAHNASGLGKLAALLTIISPLELAALASRSFFRRPLRQCFRFQTKVCNNIFFSSEVPQNTTQETPARGETGGPGELVVAHQ